MNYNCMYLLVYFFNRKVKSNDTRANSTIRSLNSIIDPMLNLDSDNFVCDAFEMFELQG